MSEADYFEDMPIVLSASRLSQSLSEAPASVSVIDQDMIRASGFRDIPDLLRLIPGFSVAYTRDNTWAVGYHGVADAFSRRFQVLVDGRSIYSAAFGAVLWSELPLSIDDVERIERGVREQEADRLPVPDRARTAQRERQGDEPHHDEDHGRGRLGGQAGRAQEQAPGSP